MNKHCVDFDEYLRGFRLPEAPEQLAERAIEGAVRTRRRRLQLFVLAAAAAAALVAAIVLFTSKEESVPPRTAQVPASVRPAEASVHVESASSAMTLIIAYRKDGLDGVRRELDRFAEERIWSRYYENGGLAALPPGGYGILLKHERRVAP